MGLWSRFRSIFGAKVNKALDRVEDPTETLDYSYQKQQELLRNVKRGLADVATAKQRLKLQEQKLRQEDDKLGSQAQRAVELGRDDLAREALGRRQTLEPQITSLQTQVQDLDQQQVKLTQASQALQTKIEMFRTEKERLKAQYSASAAQVKIGESFTGLSREMNDIGSSVQRAQDRIEQMQARSGALDELIDSGALTDYTAQLGGGGDDLDRQLQLAGGTDNSVEAQLAAMKAQLGQGDTPPRLPDG
ncbi:MAG: PspA/IM30 family protein [Chloroflexota bacterium]|nr:MAG: phage shock protein A [Chloroflexota bacterium]